MSDIVFKDCEYRYVEEDGTLCCKNKQGIETDLSCDNCTGNIHLNCDMVKKSLDVTIDVVDEYIKFWSDDGVQEFYYDISPIEVLEELKTTLITGEYPTKMVEE